MHTLSPRFAITVSGAAIDAVGWRSLFVAQAVVATIAVVIQTGAARRSAPARRHDIRFDVRGAVLLTIGMVSLLFAINRLPEWGLGHGVVQGALVGRGGGPRGVGAHERRVSAPLLPLAWLARQRSPRHS